MTSLTCVPRRDCRGFMHLLGWGMAFARHDFLHLQITRANLAPRLLETEAAS
ncbi:MAG: hypothetical protein ACK4N1_12770 [Pseudorhizobium sp.]